MQRITKIVHKEIQNKLRSFIKKNRNKKIVILDIALLLENKINKKNDILVYVESKKKDIARNLRKRKNYNSRIIDKFKNIQLTLAYKKKNSTFIINNNYTQKSVVDGIKKILKVINNERNSS